nr:MAG TPA: hypothetical protein [Caudoviricetes sp.]
MARTDINFRKENKCYESYRNKGFVHASFADAYRRSAERHRRQSRGFACKA